MSIRSPYHPPAYDQQRPLYPPELFHQIRARIGERLPSAIHLTDLGCGTGLVWTSIRDWAKELNLHYALVEPNAAMLESATQKLKLDFGDSSTRLESHQARAEALPLADSSQDGILCGSAWHWFGAEAVTEIERVLKPGGFLHVFEYQFPKALDDRLGLNEWVRRQFNERWKFEDQSPRGTLFEKTSLLRIQPELKQTGAVAFQKERSHSAEFFSELIFTQARYLDFEFRLDKQKALDARIEVRQSVRERISSPELSSFLYGYEGFTFQKRWV